MIIDRRAGKMLGQVHISNMSNIINWTNTRTASETLIWINLVGTWKKASLRCDDLKFSSSQQMINLRREWRTVTCGNLNWIPSGFESWLWETSTLKWNHKFMISINHFLSITSELLLRGGRINSNFLQAQAVNSSMGTTQANRSKPFIS